MTGKNQCELWALSYLGCLCRIYLHHLLLPRAQKVRLLLRRGYLGRPELTLSSRSHFQGGLVLGHFRTMAKDVS